MAVQDWAAYLSAGKTVLEIFRGIRAELPKGEASDAAQKHIAEAENALKQTEAELAKALGYHLCKCTFPPQIMLWREAEKATVCPNCGHRDEPPKVLNLGGPQGRGGPNSWLAR